MLTFKPQGKMLPGIIKTPQAGALISNLKFEI